MTWKQTDMSRFNTPPGWPPAPEGWVPPAGWRPDPAWPPAPEGWQFWIDDNPSLELSRQARAGENAGPFIDSVARVPGRRGGLAGIFGGQKKSLAEENEYLRGVLKEVGSLTAVDISLATADLQSRFEKLQADVRRAEQDRAEAEAAVAKAKSELVQTDEVAQLQEAGVYQYAHPLSDAVGYKDLLQRIKSDTKQLIKAGRAVSATTNWQVNGSAAQGRKMVGDFSKLLLRAYNAEADNCVRTVKPSNRGASLDRLSKAESTIARLGKTMDIHITGDYHRLRLYEIEVTADYLAKVEEERERTRAERERMRDEAAAAREIEREKARLAKEQAHYENALAKAIGSGAAPETVEELTAKVHELGGELDKIISREANIRAGWVYVISNIGSFGDDVVKIGLTRRLEPMDRVRELGDASVPFRFDVHALVFSDDAVTLETQLHHRFADRKVNMVNTAREFFYATPGEVRIALGEFAGQHLLEYREEPEAAEWRASGSKRKFSRTEAHESGGRLSGTSGSTESD